MKLSINLIDLRVALYQLLVVNYTFFFSIIYLYIGFLSFLKDIVLLRFRRWPRSTQIDERDGSKSTYSLKNIHQVNANGFGLCANKYAFAMESFKSRLFVGTSNITKPFPGIYRFALCKPVESDGAQIWAMNELNRWAPVVMSGLKDKANMGIRAISNIGDCLFALTINHEHGFEVWASSNGTAWKILAKRGFGDIRNTSGRGLIQFQDYVYVSTENRIHGAQIWRRKLSSILEGMEQCPEGEDCWGWEKVADKGLSDPLNHWFSDFIVFHEELYVGTMNNLRGMSLYKSSDGLNFDMLFSKGLTSRFNQALMKLFVFRDELYFSTMNWVKGFSVFRMQDSKPPKFVEVLKCGYNSISNPYAWNFCEYNGRLYISSYQNSILMQKLGMFSIYSSANGRDWVIETDRAFANSKKPWIIAPELGNYGVRSMKEHRGKLYFGTATAWNSCQVWEAQTKLAQPINHTVLSST